MEKSGPILEYSTPKTPPRKLTLEEADGCVRVIFPVMPKWIYVYGIASPAVLGLVAATTPIGNILIMRQITTMLGAPPPGGASVIRHFYAAQFLLFSIPVFLGWALAAYLLWMYRRWGRVPRTLTANAQCLVSSRLGLLRMRERTWAADEITAIKLRSVRGNLTPKRTLARLSILRRKGWRKHFVLSSRDPQLPSRIAQRLAEVLGCPLI
jgi:hypothetical protein